MNLEAGPTMGADVEEASKEDVGLLFGVVPPPLPD